MNAALKWPNDVLVGERKVCGILSEAVHGGAGLAAVLGMGINVRLRPGRLPVPTATSLALAGGTVDPDALVAAVLASLGGWYLRWLAAKDLRAEYAQRCVRWTPGAAVQLLRGRVRRGRGPASTTTNALLFGRRWRAGLLGRGRRPPAQGWVVGPFATGN